MYDVLPIIFPALPHTHTHTHTHTQVLHFDAANVEAIASLASHHFYTDQPEVALRFYRRLVQMGINNTELWNNLGLCCFYASQYDYTVLCMCVCMCVCMRVCVCVCGLYCFYTSQ